MPDNVTITFKPNVVGKTVIFPEVTTILDGSDIAVRTTVTDSYFRQLDIDTNFRSSPNALLAFVEKYLAPFFKDVYTWEFEREAALRSFGIYGTRSLLAKIEVSHAG